MRSLAMDVLYSMRALRKSAAFSVIVVLSLGLGIGANAAVFTLLNALVLRDLRAPSPEQLVEVLVVGKSGSRRELTYPLFSAFRERQTAFSGIVGWTGDRVANVEVDRTVVRAGLMTVTANFHAELGAVPFAGRFFSDDDLNSRNAVAIVGHGFWKRHLGGDRSAIGKTLNIEGSPFTIIGIAPQRFTGLTMTVEPEVTVPLTTYAIASGRTTESLLDDRTRAWVRTVARLKPGTNPDRARAEMQVFWPSALNDAAPSGPRRTDFLAVKPDVVSVARGSEPFLRSRFTTPLYVVLGVAALILLIACVNLASLMVTRVASKRHEMAIRVALGASRWQRMRQFVIEGFILAAAGAVVGVAVAFGSSTLLSQMVLQLFMVPAALDVRPDARVVQVVMGAALLCGVLFAVIPAWHLTRERERLSVESHRTTTRVRKTARVLVVGQVALAVALLMDAGLLLRSLREIRDFDSGFGVGRVVGSTLFPKPGGYANLDLDAYYPELHREVSRLPRVQTAALASFYPGGGFSSKAAVLADLPPAPGASIDAVLARVSPDFFSTIDMRMVAGRDFQWSDNSRSHRVAIVSRSLANRAIPNGDAVGQYIRVAGQPDRGRLEVIGVVNDARLFDIRDRNLATAYLPLLQEGTYAREPDLLVRTTAGPITIAPELRRVVASLGHEDLITSERLSDIDDRAIVQDRLSGMLAGAFAILALALTLIGLYGLMSYTAAQRAKEFAIRLAIGAGRERVLRMVLRETLSLVLIGLAIGVPLALASGRFVSAMLFGLTAGDPSTLAMVAGVLLLCGELAVWLPAWRACRVNPSEWLRL